MIDNAYNDISWVSYRGDSTSHSPWSLLSPWSLRPACPPQTAIKHYMYTVHTLHVVHRTYMLLYMYVHTYVKNIHVYVYGFAYLDEYIG